MKFYKLPTMKPYVYEIRNQYYCIGAAVFRECTNEELLLYQDIKNKTENLKEMYKEHFTVFWKKCVYDDFCKLLALCEKDYNDLEAKQCKQEYEKMLCDCTKEDCEKINSQMEMFVELLGLKDEVYIKQLSEKEGLRK